MKHLDFYVRSVYFEEGKIGVLKLSRKLLIIGIINLPLLMIWSIWKGLFQ